MTRVEAARHFCAAEFTDLLKNMVGRAAKWFEGAQFGWQSWISILQFRECSTQQIDKQHSKVSVHL